MNATIGLEDAKTRLEKIMVTSKLARNELQIYLAGIIDTLYDFEFIESEARDELYLLYAR